MPEYEDGSGGYFEVVAVPIRPTELPLLACVMLYRAWEWEDDCALVVFESLCMVAIQYVYEAEAERQRLRRVNHG